MQSIVIIQPNHYLNILLATQQWGFHDVTQTEGIRVNLKLVSGDVGDALPVAILHGLVCHELQQRTSLVEVINGLLEFKESLPLLETLWELAASD